MIDLESGAKQYLNKSLNTDAPNIGAPVSSGVRLLVRPFVVCRQCKWDKWIQKSRDPFPGQVVDIGAFAGQPWLHP